MESKNESDKDQTGEEHKGDDEANILELPVTERAIAMSIDSGAAVIIPFFNVGKYQQASFFPRIEQIEDPCILIGDGSRSPITYVRASFGTYGFNDCCSTVSVTFYYAWRSKNATTNSARVMVAGGMVLSNRVTVLLLYRCCCKEVLRYLLSRWRRRMDLATHPESSQCYRSKE